MRWILAAFFFIPARASALPAGITIYSVPTPASQNNNPLAAQFIPALNYSGPSWICTSDISTKVFQNGGTCANTWATGGWSMTVSTPSGIRNEVVGGQVHIVNPPIPLSNVNVWMSNLVNGQTGETISTQTAINTNNVILYVSSYVFISTPSVKSSTNNYFGQWNVEIPDPIIPTIDPYYHQVTNKLPMNIAAGTNQSFWYDIYIPTGISSGYYAGNIFISSGSPNTIIATIPLALELFDSTMPVTATYGSFNGVGYGDLCVQAWGSNNTCNQCGAYNCGVGGSDTCARIVNHDECTWMLDHRWSCGTNAGGWNFATLNPIFANLWGGGRSSTYINPILQGAKMTSWFPLGIGGSNETTAAAWATSFQSAGYNTSLAMPGLYPCDEPAGATWAKCTSTMTATSASGLPNLITSNYSSFLANGATGQVNVMNTIVEDYNANKANTAAWIAIAPSTRAFGYYSDCESGASGNGQGPCLGTPNGGNAVGTGTSLPNPHIDGRPVAHRADWWVTMADTGTFHLNSTATQCWATSAGCGQPIGVDSTWTFAKGMQYDGVGDENWIYPGTPTQVGVSTPIIIGSIRFEEEMAGEQDYEYWNILATNGNSKTNWTQLATWYNSEADWNNNPYEKGTYSGTITQARQNMGCAIHQLKYGSGATCGW